MGRALGDQRVRSCSPRTCCRRTREHDDGAGRDEREHAGRRGDTLTTRDARHGAWPRREDVGRRLWAAFLAACVATMLFFAFFDPVLLVHDDARRAGFADRMTGYAVGFFFFWLVALDRRLITRPGLIAHPEPRTRADDRTRAR